MSELMGMHERRRMEGAAMVGESPNNTINNNNNTETVYNNMEENSPIVEESHMRSIVKGITWRFVATMTTVIVSLWVTGEVGTAFTIGGIELFLKIGIYYIHERIWAKIRF